jgi:hypothetical protein
MANSRRWWCGFAVAAVLLPAAASGQPCIDSVEVSPQQRSRRDAAVRFIQAVNALEARWHQERGTYVALSEGRAPAAPVGFVPRLVFDRWGYVIVVKDLFDGCGFALISDEHGVVYEAHPSAPAGQAPPSGSSTADDSPLTATGDREDE